VDHDLTRRAEQAALGAMITDRQLAARLGYLEPEDFTDPRHSWVFRTIRQLSATQQQAPGNWSDLIAKTAGRWVTRKYLDELAAACPDPAHGPAYGAMLVQAAVYRQARGHADEMDDHAIALRAEGSRLTAANAPGAGRAARLGALLAEVARAVRGHTAALAPAALGPADIAGPRPRAAAATPADRREELVLSAVVQGHPEAGQILSYLPAAAFSSPERQEIFRAARRLSQSGRPVDELTVSWELATRSAADAVLSPESTPRPQGPDGYIAWLAGTGISASQSPLRAAHDLDAQLRHRTSHGPRPAAGNRDQVEDAPAAAVVVPLLRPQNAAEARPAGPEHR
jgi:DnaB-like helicase N terminal domain